MYLWLQTTRQGTYGCSYRQPGVQSESVCSHQGACGKYIDQAQDGAVGWGAGGSVQVDYFSFLYNAKDRVAPAAALGQA